MNQRVIASIAGLFGIAALARKAKGVVLNYDSLTSLWYPLAKKYANKNNVTVDIILGIIKQESNGREDAKGVTNDFGLMQITQGALTDFNVANKNSYTLSDMLQAEPNIEVGSWYFSRMKRLTGSDQSGLQAYNAGYGNWTRNKNVSLSYAQSVLQHTNMIAQFVRLEERKGTNV